MVCIKPVMARRAGWSAVSVTECGSLRFAYYGTCPDRCPTAHRAELWGILMALRRGARPLEILTDHKLAVDAWKRGRLYCCDGSRMAADLWRSIWSQIDALPGDGPFVLTWTKGHTGQVDVDRGVTTERNSSVNNQADRFAGLGRDMAVEAVPNQEQVEVYQRAKAFYRRVLLRLCAKWPEDYCQLREKPKAAAKAKAQGLGVHRTAPHTIWRTIGGHILCERCGKTTSAPSAQATNTFARSPCLARPIRGGPKDRVAEALVAGRVKDLLSRGATRLATRPVMMTRPPRPAPLRPPPSVVRQSVAVEASVQDLRAGSKPTLVGTLIVNVKAGSISVAGGGGQNLGVVVQAPGEACPLGA